MPELPEVETIVRGLARHVVGDVIESVWIGSRTQPLKSPARTIERTLRGARITAVRRVGKHIVIDLQNGNLQRGDDRSAVSPATASAQWIVHLGMTGRLLICPPGDAVEKHTHAIARLASGRELRFV